MGRTTSRRVGRVLGRRQALDLLNRAVRDEALPMPLRVEAAIVYLGSTTAGRPRNLRPLAPNRAVRDSILEALGPGVPREPAATPGPIATMTNGSTPEGEP